jgi:hypothetical protein
MVVTYGCHVSSADPPVVSHEHKRPVLAACSSRRLSSPVEAVRRAAVVVPDPVALVRPLWYEQVEDLDAYLAVSWCARQPPNCLSCWLAMTR